MIHRSIRTIAALLSIGFLLPACRGPVLGMLGRQVESAMRANLPAELPDGLHVLLCGAGGPMPDPKRSGPCVAIIAGESVVMIDSGSGAARNLARFGLQPGLVEAVFLTHFHSDHIDGLGEVATLRWVGAGWTTPLPVFGPEGVGEVVDGFNRSYQQDQGYRTEHHGTKVAPPLGAGLEAKSFSLPANGERPVVFEKGDLRIMSFAVDHAPVSPAVGYRIEYKGRSVVVSGDTAKSPNLIANSMDVDLLVHEALSRTLVRTIQDAAQRAGNDNMVKITGDILDYHASPVEAAQSAQEAGADYLLFYHIVPPLPVAPLESIYLEGVGEVFSGKFKIGVDGTFISLPANAEAIEVGER